MTTTENEARPPADLGEIAGDDAPVTAVPFARATADQIARLAGLAQVGVIFLGGTLGLSRSPEALATGAPGMAVVGLAATVGLAVVVGLIVGHLLRGLAALLYLQAERADGSERLEAALAALPGRAFVPLLDAPPQTVDLKGVALAEARRAIREGRWADAQALAKDFADDHPEAPEAARLLDELAVASKAAAEDFLSRIETAREINDPDRVIELRDEVKLLIAADALRELDRDLGRWFMMLIQRRLRAGTVRADVAVLAGKIAASLDDTPEGASLRASLPTLRRAAGLCPRCGEPYPGTANACPACVAGLKPTPPDSPPSGNGHHGIKDGP